MDYPSVINQFNVYNAGNRLIGLTGEVSLPEINSKTTTVNGAGNGVEYAVWTLLRSGQ